MRCSHEHLFRNAHGAYECSESNCDFQLNTPMYERMRTEIERLEAEKETARNSLPQAIPAFVVRAAKPGDVVFLTLQKCIDTESHRALLNHLQLYTANLGIKFVVLGPEFAPMTVEVEARDGDLMHRRRHTGPISKEEATADL